MQQGSAPRIFDRALARRRLARALAGGLGHAPATFLLERAVEDLTERLGAVLRPFPRVLDAGTPTAALARALASLPDQRAITRLAPLPEADDPRWRTVVGDEEALPFAPESFDLIVSALTLQSVNDLPGALIHLRNALAPGGLMIASFPGAGSLPALRAAMLAADGERPAARLHPMVDVRAGGQLLQRAGFTDPVVDSRTLSASFRDLHRLLGDLRAQGLSGVLASPAPRLGKAAHARACATFAAQGSDGRTVERFEILTLSGWRK